MVHVMNHWPRLLGISVNIVKQVLCGCDGLQKNSEGMCGGVLQKGAQEAANEQRSLALFHFYRYSQ